MFMTIWALGFGMLWAFYYVLNLYVSVGGSSDCKLVVFLYLYVGGSDELQPGGSFLQLPPRWILPADCRRPPLSLSWSGSPKGSAEWSQRTAWAYAVSFLLLHMHIQTQTGYRETQYVISQLWCVSSDDFVLLKLKKEAAEDGAFLVRWSALDYQRIILAVLNKNEVSQHPLSSREIFAMRWWWKILATVCTPVLICAYGS